ncbi:nitrate- and nitrite sensing domain-containing protein [Nocardia abscessus]|uniref:sensor histidine kinase n=1 Tax=Nocardia abscessus TaxID=120957 RepID=UPI0018959F29|nr:ATP-binding protein [Nocardia abscessus]
MPSAEAEPSVEDTRSGSSRRPLRARFGTSVRTRVLAIALIPSLVLLATGAVAVTLVGLRAQSVKEWSDYRGTVIDPLLRFVTSIQAERLASVTAQDHSPGADAELRTSRDDTDRAIAETARIASAAQDMDQDTGAESIQALSDLVGRMQVIRESVDSRKATTGDVDQYFSDLIAAMLGAGQDSARLKSSDTTTMDAEMTAIDLLRAAESHSRVVSLVAAGTAAADGLSPRERRVLAQHIGVYRKQFDLVDTRLSTDVRTSVRSLTGGADWRVGTAGEDEMAERGELMMPVQQWLAAERAVDTRLIAVIRDQFRVTVDATSAAADRLINQLLIVSAIMLFVTILAVSGSLVLANRLLRRLRTLRSASLELANDRLPDLIRRIHNGEQVDAEAETAPVDSGRDEIGQVAAAFAIAQRTAIETAVGEASTRNGFNKVFLDIAFRSQALVRRQLDVLDVAEARQDDPEDLELLFQLDHLATRARRNSENLLILGGRAPGRRWRNPVALEEIVRSAVSETEGYARVSAIRLPALSVLGAAVADLIHLLAELIDNATAFSPPDALVAVHGNSVGRGVVVEVDDQGLGISFEERERLNAMLAEPPQFHEMALAGHRHLGLFVVSRLSARHGISVTLQESPYGGVRAIVLVPWAVLEAGDDNPTAAIEPVRSRDAVHRVPGATALPGAPRPDQVPASALPDRVGRADLVGHNGYHAASQEPPARLNGHPVAEVDRRPALPVRERLTHLSPQLGTDVGDADSHTVPPGSTARVRAPETVRTAMSSLQNGTRRARIRPPHSHP